MMAKIVHDLPSQPISYLVEFLQNKYNARKVIFDFLKVDTPDFRT